MEFNLYSLFLLATIFWLSCVNGQFFQTDQNNNVQTPPIQSSSYDPPYKIKTIRIVTSDQKMLQFLQSLDSQELQRIVYQRLYPYFEDYGITPGTVIDIKVQNEARTVGGFNPLPLPNIRPPTITNIRPSTILTPGPYGLNAFSIGGMGSLKPSLFGRETEYNQVGRPQTRSIDNVCITESINRACSGGNDPASSSLKSSAQKVDLHQINARDNDKNQGRGNEENFKNIDDEDINELTNKFVNVLQGEIVHLLRDSYKDNSNNSNFTIDPTQLKNMLKMHLGQFRNQTSNPTRPINPYSTGIYNNGWNPRSEDANSQNPNSWWTSPYNYPTNGRTVNPNFNYPGQIGNPYAQPMNYRQPGNSNYGYPPMFNNGQVVNPNYNYPTMKMNGQPGNPNSPPATNSSGNSRPGNSSSNYPPMNNRPPVNSTQNLKPVNNTKLPVNPNYNAPSANPTGSGFLYPNLQPSMNSGRPNVANTFAQNNPYSGINSQPYNNYGTSPNIPSQTPAAYPVNVGYQSGNIPITVPQDPNANSMYGFQTPLQNMQTPTYYNPYDIYIR